MLDARAHVTFGTLKLGPVATRTHDESTSAGSAAFDTPRTCMLVCPHSSYIRETGCAALRTRVPAFKENSTSRAWSISVNGR